MGGVARKEKREKRLEEKLKKYQRSLLQAKEMQRPRWLSAASLFLGNSDREVWLPKN